MKHYFKRFKNKLGQIINSMKIIFGTKKKVDKMNFDSINNIKKGKKELTFLIHGVGVNYYRAMYPILTWFKKKKMDIVSIGYDSSKDIEISGIIINKQIENIMKKANVSKINLIGISLGGLVARYYIECLGGKRKVNKLITV